LYYSSSEINKNKNKVKILPTEGGKTPQIFPEEKNQIFLNEKQIRYLL
jgi:hypothetical protein